MSNQNKKNLDYFEDDIPSMNPETKGKRILLIVIPAIILIISAVIYGILYFIKEVPTTERGKGEQQIISTDYSFVDMKDIIVSIASNDNKKNFLKISLTLQAKNKDVADLITEKLPIINDSFQIFLKELRPSDLSGSAGTLMLKTELIKRVNRIIAPQTVTDVLFKEILLS